MYPALVGDEGDIEEAWKMYTWMEALQWHFLPHVGALEDQDELLINNVFMIADSVERLRHPEGK